MEVSTRKRSKSLKEALKKVWSFSPSFAVEF